MYYLLCLVLFQNVTFIYLLSIIKRTIKNNFSRNILELMDSDFMSFHDWFKNGKIPLYLEEYLKNRHLRLDFNAQAFSIKEDEQSLHFTFIRAVKLEEIKEFEFEEGDEIKDHRADEIKKWATQEKLLRIPLCFDEDGVIYYSRMGYIIDLSRNLNENNWQNPPKFNSIIDGIHRIAFARKSNYEFILAEITESFNIKKSEMRELGENSIEQNINLDQVNYNELIDTICAKLHEFKVHKFTRENIKKEKLDYIIKFRSYLYSNKKMVME